ncbi:MAG: hypothetical protein GW909_00025 [Sphingomonadales bacterium]|nr:hypothetical protein [Sphingomonadales bacterium]
MMAETSTKVSNMFGDKLYQQRARMALPVLVRQAGSEKPIYYENLAIELGMPNPRNLDWVLGSIGVSLNELASSKDWNEAIPHIQSLVINQRQKLPGSGFEGFLAERVSEYTQLGLNEKRAYLRGYWLDIFAYPYWDDVLEAFGLENSSPQESELIEEAKHDAGAGGGEGPEHLALKHHVRDNPTLVGLPITFPVGTEEEPLPSGDRIDVLFKSAKLLLGVEVKSRISNDVDLIRGLFQCVKYRAVMDAERAFERQKFTVDAVLVVGRAFPEHLQPLKNSLGVRVFEVIEGQ